MITRETIINLANQESDLCISIYLPTHKMGEQVQQDPIRLKNLLNEVQKRLKSHDITDQKIETLLEKPTKLLDKPSFWAENDEGLAFFISDEYFDFFRIPHSPEQRLMIDNHFLITPLVPMISLEGTFCVLALSQKRVRLLRCTRTNVENVELDDTPLSMDEFRQYNVYEKNIYTGGNPRAQTAFQGWGDGSYDRNDVENYLKIIENEVTSILRKWNDPLVLAGVKEVAALYKKINHYHRLMDQVVTGNPDPWSDDEIKKAGWEKIQSYFLKDMYEDMRRFGNLTDTEKQSENLTKIVEAAYYGKIDSLFVSLDGDSWGWFDPDHDVVHHSAEPKNGEHDLINMAAIKTLTQSGNVYALDKDNMPNNASIAAIFRYS
ncbi:MAG TPA: hypothetical protein VFG39_05330 [Balneolaceae bacterium]|nr:hypothetical protein [Balneolaceae bacterium]